MAVFKGGKMWSCFEKLWQLPTLLMYHLYNIYLQFADFYTSYFMS